MTVCDRAVQGGGLPAQEQYYTQGYKDYECFLDEKGKGETWGFRSSGYIEQD